MAQRSRDEDDAMIMAMMRYDACGCGSVKDCLYAWSSEFVRTVCSVGLRI